MYFGAFFCSRAFLRILKAKISSDLICDVRRIVASPLAAFHDEPMDKFFKIKKIGRGF